MNLNNGLDTLFGRQEFLNKQIEDADQIYEQVVKVAKKKVTIWNGWIQASFNLNWTQAEHILKKMRKDGICGENDPSNGMSKILSK